MERTTNRAPLADIVVLEIGQAMSAPYCTQILADLGARILKLEKLEGDDSRGMPPHFVGDTSAYFLSVNRGKESIAIDLKSTEGRALALRLVAKSHALVSNLRPGALERLGLGNDALERANPCLVSCSISGFGQSGPYREMPAFDMIIQALSGGMSVTGEEGGKPVRSGIPVADMSAGMAAVIGILAALRLAQSSNTFQIVDISMLDVQVSMLSYLMVYYLLSGRVPGLQGRGHTGVPETGAFTCADGVDIVLQPLAEDMWRNVCLALQRHDLLQCIDYATRKDRINHKRKIREELAATIATQPSSLWLQRLREHEVPVAVVNTLDEVAVDPQVLHREMLLQSSYGGNPVTLVGSPIKVARQSSTLLPPPALGQHTAPILREFLGMEDEAIEGYAERRIVLARGGVRNDQRLSAAATT